MSLPPQPSSTISRSRSTSRTAYNDREDEKAFLPQQERHETQYTQEQASTSPDTPSAPSIIPSWFQQKSSGLLPMPVQDASDDKPKGWSTKVLLGAVATAMVMVWIVAAAVGGGKVSSSSVKETVMTSKEVDASGLQGVWNSTLGFQKIYVINLATRTDQKDALTLLASAMNLELTFINAVLGINIDVKGLPSGYDKVKPGGRGDWRSNMDILQLMISDNVQSALILEDDADFDIRIRDQLSSFASASRILTTPSLLSQDPPLANDANNYEVPLSRIPQPSPSPSSPYGNNWDVLWLGHCGTSPARRSASTPILLSANDTTVSQPSYITTVLGMYDGLIKHHAAHTRFYDRAGRGICSQAVGVSLRGAKRVVWEAEVSGVRGLEAMDYVLNDFCGNTYTGSEDVEPYAPASASASAGKKASVVVREEHEHICITTQPTLFSQFRAKGSTLKDSNIQNLKHEKTREKASSAHVRYSARINLGRLMEGERCERGWDVCVGFEDGAPDLVGGEVRDEDEGEEEEVYEWQSAEDEANAVDEAAAAEEKED